MPNPVADFPWDKVNVLGTALVKAGSSVLHTINFNGMTVVGILNVFDGIDNTGTIIGTLILDSAIHVSCQPMCFIYDCKMDIGIYLEYTGGLAADFTVTFI